MKQFYELIEKDGYRKAVYSSGDLLYMLNRGWNKLNTPSAEHTGTSAEQTDTPAEQPVVQPKRGPGRPKRKS
jgi:hypothetical protein